MDKLATTRHTGSQERWSIQTPGPARRQERSLVRAVLCLSLAVSAMLVAALAGCGSDCAPLVQGSPFGQDGTAVIRGAATIPDTIDGGLQMQLLIAEQASGVRVGVIPENLFESPRTCGSTELDYEITRVEAGTYSIFMEITDPDADFAEVYNQQADKTVTVADGQTVEADLVFGSL